MSLSKSDGSQPYTIIKQLANTEGIYVDISKSSIVDSHLGKHHFVEVFANLGKNIRPGTIVNGDEVSYTHCGHMISGYFAFIPNEEETRPSAYHTHTPVFGEVGVAVDW